MYRLTKKRTLSAILSALVCLVVSLLIGQSFHASAVTGADWNAGNIISDSQFFNSSSMSSAEIQNFLNSMVPTCDTWHTGFYGSSGAWYGPPFTCLKNYTENNLTAAQIIYNAAKTYSINPKVLLVLLQKEQSLITDTWPASYQYKSATGYGCPDTAPCDTQYYGFTNQVNLAAHQFQLYAATPNSYRYKAYQSNSILWSPTTSCGSSSVYIANQATAGLYNYTPYQPNQAALNNLYGTGDSCSAYGNRNFWRIYNDWFGSTQSQETFIEIRSHLSHVGWTNITTNNGVTGTTGQSIPMEGYTINGNVQYTSYSYSTGWQPLVSNGMVSGTINRSRPIQAIKVTPTSTLASKYDVYYRVHVSNIGWMGWAKNGNPAGVTGDNNKKIEAIETRLIVKGYGISGTTDNSYQNTNTINFNPPISLNVTSHVGSIGWQPSVNNDMVSGVIMKRKRIEALKVSLNNQTGISGDIIYSAHVAGIGWQNYVSNGGIAGTTGQSRQMEAVKIALTGDLGDGYDIWYRGYVQHIGWFSWAKNGQAAGSVGVGYQLEAIDTMVTQKGAFSPTQQNSLYNPDNKPVPANDTLNCSAYIMNLGWVAKVQQNNTCGTTGQSKPLDAIRLSDIFSIFGSLNVNCSVYVKGSGWTADVTSGSVCGTNDQSKPLQAIKLSIFSNAASKYDIYYRVHLSNDGWQAWVSNGTVAGTPISGNNIEAIDIKLVQK